MRQNGMVSIVTVNYNGWEDTCELISSLKQWETYPYEVIVVDNASRGDDVARIRAAHPDVAIVPSSKNLGFAGGNNLGYRHTQGEYILFLNNDMVLLQEFLRPMVERLQNPQIGGVSPRIYSYYNQQQLQYYGYCDLTSITLRHTTKPFDPTRLEDYLQPKVTDVLHGAAMMVRRDVIEKAGCMTEVYFLFYEEFDWSHRIREVGYQLFYEPASAVFHKEGATMPVTTPFREYYLYRSRALYARRNVCGWRKWAACAYMLFIVMSKKLVEYLRNKRFDLLCPVIRGICSGLFVAKKNG